MHQHGVDATDRVALPGFLGVVLRSVRNDDALEEVDLLDQHRFT
jgi:hypothetical protein